MKHRGEQIAKSLERMYQIKAKIAKLTEEHLADLRADFSNIKKKLREDYNMPSKLVNARFVTYSLERQAQDGHDDITLDAIREMFEYVPVGGQGSLIPGFEAAEKPRKGKLPTIEECETLGKLAFETGDGEDAFPETITTKARKEAWLKGWHAAQRDEHRAMASELEDQEEDQAAE